jgi:hypothetical protein
LYAGVANIYGKNKTIYEIVKKGRQIHVSFAPTAKVMATAHDKCIEVYELEGVVFSEVSGIPVVLEHFTCRQ